MTWASSTGWTYTVTNTSTYAKARNDTRIHYGGGEVFYVRSDGLLQNLYQVNGVWYSDWLNPNAPRVKAGTDFDVVPSQNNNVYYIGDDNNIYKMYWASSNEWKNEKFNIINSSSLGAKANYNVAFANNQLYYVANSDTKIHTIDISSVPINSRVNELASNNNDDSLNNNQIMPLLNDKQSFEAVKLYPNPNNGNMNVNYELPENETGTFEIYDLMGKKLYSYPLLGGKNLFSINEETLGQGIYLYKALAGNKLIATDKIVVIK